jgi:uncharacterized protein YjiS (DUF1127 family)
MEKHVLKLHLPEIVNELLVDIAIHEKRTPAEILKRVVFEALAPDFISLKLTQMGRKFDELDPNDIEAGKELVFEMIEDLGLQRKRIDGMLKRQNNVREEVSAIAIKLNQVIKEIEDTRKTRAKKKNI